MAAETLTDLRRRRNTKLKFWGMCIVGILVAVLYLFRSAKADEERQYRAARADEDRQRRTEEAQQAALKAQVDLRAIEKSNGEQIFLLQKQVKAVIARPESQEQKAAALQIEGTLAVLAETLKKQSVVPSPFVPSQVVQVAPALPPAQRLCRGDHLSECDDTELLEWGASLMEQVGSIRNTYAKDQKELDDIKNPGWFGSIFGKDKWLSKFADMRHNAADQFRDCCAEDALKYHRELAQRTGGGLQENKLYEWAQKLLKPIKSKEWKEAREDGENAAQITYDLEILQLNLKSKIEISKINSLRR